MLCLQFGNQTSPETKDFNGKGSIKTVKVIRIKSIVSD